MLQRALLVAVATALCIPAVAQAGDRSAPTAGTQSQLDVARSLANRVVAAKTNLERRHAFVAVMREMHISVFSASGAAIVLGSAKSWQDLYLYDIELAAAANAMGRGRTFSLDLLARELGRMRVRAVGRNLTPVELRTAIRTATVSALANPNDARSLGPLLVRELGLRHSTPFDTAKVEPLAKIKLDSLQHMLYLADVVDWVARRQQLQSAFPAALATSPCALPSVRKASRLGKFVNSLIPIAKEIAKAVGTPILDVYHAITVGLSLEASQYPEVAIRKTHYGPAGDLHPASLGHEPGWDLVFKVQVMMNVRWDEDTVACGELANLKIPPAGPVPGIPVHWDTAVPSFPGYDDLKKHGTIIREDAMTGSNGVAMLILRPKKELMPTVGTLKLQRGNLLPTFDILTPFGNTMAGVSEFLMPRFVTLGWSVERHQARGYRFNLRRFYGNDTVSHNLDARVCGEDPYAVPWTGEHFGHTGWEFLRVLRWQFKPDEATRPQELWEGQLIADDWFLGRLLATVPAKVRIVIKPGLLGTKTVTTFIEENPDCPAPPN